VKKISLIAVLALAACGSQAPQLTQAQLQAAVQAACVASVAAEGIHGVASDVTADTSQACTTAGAVITLNPAGLPASAPVAASAPVSK
jgi:uncharacterized lipoprotein YmbA